MARQQDAYQQGGPSADPRKFTVPGSDRVYDRNYLLVVLLVPLLMSLLQVSSVNTMLTPMAESIGASEQAQQWVLAGFALAIGITLIPAGRIGDIFGRSIIFVIGLVVFTLASGLIGLASTPLFVNIWRLLQGIGGGLFAPQITGIITQYFDGRQRAKAFALFGLVVSVAVGAGPLISGFSLLWFGENWGWRIAFLINVPLGLIGIILATQLLPFGKERRHVGKHHEEAELEYERAERAAGYEPEKDVVDLDPIGMILITLSVLGILLPFILPSSWAWWLLAVAAVLLVAWVVWEQRYKRNGHVPMVDLSLFSIKSFSYATAVGAFEFLGMPPIFAILAIYLQGGFNVSALEVAFVILPNAVVSAFAAMWAGSRTFRHGAGIQVMGMGVILLGALGIILVVFGIDHGDISYWWLAVPTTVMGFGSGALGAANNTLAMLDMPPQNAGTAGGVYQTAQRITTAIGNAMITAVFFGTIKGSSELGDWDAGLTLGMVVVSVMLLIGLALAFAYWRYAYRRRLHLED